MSEQTIQNLYILHEGVCTHAISSAVTIDGNPTMAEPLSKAIVVPKQKDPKGHYQPVKIDLTKTLKKLFNMYTGLYLREDKYLQFSFLNSNLQAPRT